MGGGAPAVALTADLVARAIIAAAQSFGDDPVIACTTKVRKLKRSLSAAAGGLFDAGVRPMARLERVLGLRPDAAFQARRIGKPTFRAAQAAAADAVGWALRVAGDVPPPAEAPAAPAPLVEVTACGAAPETRARRTAASPYDTAHPKPAPVPAPPPVAYSPPRAGRISATLGVGRQPYTANPAPEAARSTGDLVLEVLAEGPLNSMSLAFRADRKELAVVEALKALEREGRVRQVDVEGGPRRYVWEIAA